MIFKISTCKLKLKPKSKIFLKISRFTIEQFSRGRIIKGTSGKGIKLTPYTNQTPDNHLSSKKVADDYGLTLDGTEQTYILDFAKDEEAVKKWGARGEAYALGIVYNAYNESQGDNSYDKGNKLYCDITVKSVTLLKKIPTA